MAYQGRLLPEALFRPEDFKIHLSRGQFGVHHQGDVSNYDSSTTAIVRRIHALDPLGLKSHALATEVEGMSRRAKSS
ncbi:hypothetical protein FJZ17_00795 [Candidatus Pacearchaeota archaeon]|nr:hypothetical protein [Candidatus Pacearchaeota archaeon]